MSRGDNTTTKGTPPGITLRGLSVNGPYALITTAVFAGLGTHSSLKGDSRAVATATTAIIDGTGSVGASFGPLLTGFISTKGWDDVFIMLTTAAFIAGLLLTRLVMAETAERTSKPLSTEQQDPGAPASQPLLDEEGDTRNCSILAL